MLQPLLSATVSLAAVLVAVDDELSERASALLAERAGSDVTAGASAAIAVDGEIVWADAVGHADLEGDVLATTEMVHRIASISKPMTAVLTLQLVEDGVLDLDADVRAYVPEFPEKEWPFTLRQLLSHTSGIRHYGIEGAWTMEHYDDLTDAFVRFESSALLFEPGTEYRYSTYAYTIVGAAIEAATERDLEELMRERIWEPAGMTATRFERRGVEIEHAARGYRMVRGELAPAIPSDLSMKYPGGGMVSTASDLVRFAHAFESGLLVEDETRAEMLTEVRLTNGEGTGYGLGWGVRRGTDGELIAYSHSGGQRGTTSMLTVEPGKGAAAILANTRGAEGITGVPRALLRLIDEPAD